MATVKAFIRTGKKDREANIRFRISDGRNVQLYHKSELLILPSLWDEKREQYKAKCIVKTEDRIRLNTAISDRKKLLLSIYNETPGITSEKLEQLADEHLHPEKYHKSNNNFFDLMESYLQKRKLSEVRERNFQVLLRSLKRYELFISACYKKDRHRYNRRYRKLSS